MNRRRSDQHKKKQYYQEELPSLPAPPSNSYVVTYATATCHSSCRVCHRRFQVHDIRLGAILESLGGFHNVRWHHLRCVLPPSSHKPIMGIDDLRETDRALVRSWMEGQPFPRRNSPLQFESGLDGDVGATSSIEQPPGLAPSRLSRSNLPQDRKLRLQSLRKSESTPLPFSSPTSAFDSPTPGPILTKSYSTVDPCLRSNSLSPAGRALSRRIVEIHFMRSNSSVIEEATLIPSPRALRRIGIIRGRSINLDAWTNNKRRESEGGRLRGGMDTTASNGGPLSHSSRAILKLLARSHRHRRFQTV